MVNVMNYMESNQYSIDFHPRYGALPIVTERYFSL